MGTSTNLRTTVTINPSSVVEPQVEVLCWKSFDGVDRWFMVWNEFYTQVGQPLRNVKLLIQNDLREKQLKKLVSVQ